MNPKINDGGPAHPGAALVEDSNGPVRMIPYKGMTLRQWYAGMALQGMLASDFVGRKSKIQIGSEWLDYDVAAVKLADLIIAREASTRQASQNQGACSPGASNQHP